MANLCKVCGSAGTINYVYPEHIPYCNLCLQNLRDGKLACYEGRFLRYPRSERPSLPHVHPRLHPKKVLRFRKKNGVEDLKNPETIEFEGDLPLPPPTPSHLHTPTLPTLPTQSSPHIPILPPSHTSRSPETPPPVETLRARISTTQEPVLFSRESLESMANTEENSNSNSPHNMDGAPRNDLNQFKEAEKRGEKRIMKLEDELKKSQEEVNRLRVKDVETRAKLKVYEEITNAIRADISEQAIQDKLQGSVERREDTGN